jgi:hypothetical protein
LFEREKRHRGAVVKDASNWGLWAPIAGILALMLSVPGVSAAQEPTSNSSVPNSSDGAPGSQVESPVKAYENPNDKQQNYSPLPADSWNPEAPRPPMALVSPLFRVSGSKQAGQSPLRFGPLSIGSMEVLGAYNSFTPSDGSTKTRQSGVFMRSDIVLDEVYKNVRFTTQWEPRLSILDGTYRGDPGNGASGIDLTLDLTRKLDLRLADRFTYFASRLFYGDYFLTSAEVQAPVSQQNSFLDAPGHSLSNSAIFNLNYKVSPLTTIYFSPTFNYFHTTTSTALLDSSQEYNGALGVVHLTSEKTTVGLNYNLTAAKFKHDADVVLYNTVNVTYAHMLSPTFSFTSSAGVSTFRVANDPRSWTFAGSASLTKAFRASSIVATFTRGLYQADYTTTAFTNRLDGLYNQSVGHRLMVALGGGWQKESRTHGFDGRYAQVGLGFHLSSMIVAFARYSYLFQIGDQRYLVTGTRNLVVFGLRFEAQAPTLLFEPTTVVHR